jgi:hypothetical protein
LPSSWSFCPSYGRLPRRKAPSTFVHMVRRTLLTEETKARCWETVQVSVLLLALLAIFFGEAIFLGRKLLPADIAYTDPVYLRYAPADFIKPHNTLLYDQAYQFYPSRVYTSQALRQGFLPFWNPYVYCGTPMMAEDQPAVFYPLNILSYVFSPPDATLFTALARMLIAGLATYWFVRALGGGRFGALVSSVTFTFSGFMIVWLGHPHTNVAAWLPAFFLTGEWLHRRTSVRHIAFVALIVAAQLTAGHAETALYTLTAGGLYYLFRLVTTWWGDRRLRPAVIRLLFFGTAVALGFVLASIHLLPFWEWLQYSAELQLRTGSGGLRATQLGPKYWLAGILPMLLPNIFNNPTWPGDYRSFFPGWNFVEQTLYVGVIGLALAVGVMVARRRDKQVWFLAMLGLVTLGAALRLPVFDWLNHLPLFNIAAYGRLRLIYTFCTAVLAGLGARDMLHHMRRDDVLRTVIRVLAGLVVVGILVLLIAPRILGQMHAQAATAGVRQVSQAVLSRAFSVSNVGMHWPLLIAPAGVLLLTLYLRRVMSHKMMQAILLLLVIVDLFALGMGYHATIREELIFPETPALQLIKSDEDIFRVVGTNIDLMPNTSIIHGLYDVRGLDFPGRRYQELCLAMGGQDWLGYGILFTESLQPRLLGLLNVKYVLTSSRLGPERLRYLQLLDVDKDIHIYKNLSCLPRAFIVHRVRVSEDGQGVLQILQEPGFELGSEIVLEKPPPPGFVAGVAESDVELSRRVGGGAGQRETAQATAEIARYEPNYVQIEVNSSNNGFLFLSDSYYPGWKAYVDGDETEIYQADYAFRAVYLTSGQHTVEFSYEPRSFKLASLASSLALLAVIVLLVGPWSWKAGDSVASV